MHNREEDRHNRLGVRKNLHNKPFSFFLATSASIAIARTVCAPLERVRIVFQTDAELVKSHRLTQKFANYRECVLHIMKQEGVLAFWRGNNPAVFMTLAPFVLAFITAGHVSRLFETIQSHRAQLLAKIALSAASASATVAILYPLDFARTRLACDVLGSKERQFKGTMDVWQKIYKMDGIRGIYRGFGFHALGIFISYLGPLAAGGVLATVSRRPSTIEGQAFTSIVFGSIMVVNYGLDTASRRAMVSSGEAWKYENSKEAYVRILRSDGIHALVRGATVGLFTYFAFNFVSLAVNIQFDPELKSKVREHSLRRKKIIEMEKEKQQKQKQEKEKEKEKEQEKEITY